MKTSAKAIITTLLLTLGFVSACSTDELGSTSTDISGRPFFELFEGADGDYYFNLAATNHEVVLSSEGYSSRQSALSGILSVLNNGGETANYELREATNGQYYFVLQAQNGQTIGMSELYSTKGNAKQGIQNTAEVSDDYLAFQATRTGARFTILEGSNGLYYFNLRAKNGQIVLRSQAYSSEAAALNATFVVAEVGSDIENYQHKKASDGRSFFNLKSGNGEIVATGQMYSTKSNATRATKSIVALLPNVDLL